MFRMNGYAQDVRYIAGEHMDVRRDCVSFAQRIITSAGAASLRLALHKRMNGYAQVVRYIAGERMGKVKPGT